LRNILGLDERVQYFHRTFGKGPSDLKDLVEKGLVKEIPSDTLGLGFCLERTNASGSEEVRVGSLFY